MRIFTIVLGIVLAASFVGGCGSSNDEPRSGREGKSAKVKTTSALYEAAKDNNVAKVEELLAEGYDVDSKGRDGRTALWVACYEGNVRLATMLLEKGADPSIADNGRKRTPMMYVADKRYNELLKKMLATKPDVNAQDEHGMTAAHMAANKRDAVAVRMLRAAGADLTIQDNRGRTVEDLILATTGKKLSDFPATTNPLQ